MDSTTVHVLLVVFFGYPEPLIAVPLLALRIPIEIAAPLAVLLSILVAAVVVVQDWRRIHLHSTGWLLAPTFLGIPLAIVLIAFSGYSLVGKSPPELRSDSRPWLPGCGFLAGVLGGAYGMNGPPLVIYGAMRRWSPQHFRATPQGYFLPCWQRYRPFFSGESSIAVCGEMRFSNISTRVWFAWERYCRCRRLLDRGVAVCSFRRMLKNLSQT
jgi:uncharacterized protein